MEIVFAFAAAFVVGIVVAKLTTIENIKRVFNWFTSGK